MDSRENEIKLLNGLGTQSSDLGTQTQLKFKNTKLDTMGFKGEERAIDEEDREGTVYRERIRELEAEIASYAVPSTEEHN